MSAVGPSEAYEHGGGRRWRTGRRTGQHVACRRLQRSRLAHLSGCVSPLGVVPALTTFGLVSSACAVVSLAGRDGGVLDVEHVEAALRLRALRPLWNGQRG